MTKSKSILIEDVEKTAKEIWSNCIHKNIGSFTLTQEKRAIEDIEEYLKQKLKSI